MKTAMPSAIGVAMSSASTDEYSVPQMNGSAPNSPDTGSQISVRQKSKPNFAIDSIDCRDQLEADGADDEDEGEREDACPQPEAEILLNHRLSTSRP